MRPACVVVPFRGGCEHRERAWAYLRARYEQLGLDVVEGGCDGPWRKAVAVNDAIKRSSAEILVIADADVWCDNISESIDEVRGEAHWSVPHSKVHRLTDHATEAVLAGGPFGGTTEEPPYPGVEGGGIVVLERELWERAPMDPRFVGWGQEDEAWGIALRNHGLKIRRLNGMLWHLWHPPQERASRGIGSTESFELFRQYVYHPDRALDEARRALQEH